MPKIQNKLFGHWGFAFARAVLRLTCAKIARMHGYSSHTWRKYEENTRAAPPDLVSNLEDLIQKELKAKRVT